MTDSLRSVDFAFCCEDKALASAFANPAEPHTTGMSLAMASNAQIVQVFVRLRISDVYLLCAQIARFYTGPNRCDGTESMKENAPNIAFIA